MVDKSKSTRKGTSEFFYEQHMQVAISMNPNKNIDVQKGNAQRKTNMSTSKYHASTREKQSITKETIKEDGLVSFPNPGMPLEDFSYAFCN